MPARPEYLRDDMQPTDLSRRRLMSTAVSLALPLAAAWHASAAEPYPSGVVELVVPFGVASVSDMTGRMLAAHLQKAFGKPCIVENRVGANGSRGSRYVASAKPDGLTLVLATNTSHSVIDNLMRSVPYDPERDFAPVARIASLESMIVVSQRLPVRSIAEFVALARRKPGTLSYGYGNSSGEVAGETLKHDLKLDIVAVPYRSNPQAMTDVIAGNIDAMVVDLATGIPQCRSGVVRPLAMLSATRSDIFPSVPTLAETVSPGFGVTAWAGILAPAGTPKEVIRTLSTAIRAFDARTDVQRQLLANGVLPSFADTPEFTTFLKAERVRWTSIAARAGIIAA
jgi:tripartite-type tricarboxylate transporter receptor subunit TctC